MERQSILESMERIAIVLSTRDSNAIEGIGTMAERMVPLIVGDTKPIGHSESEILGYGDCLRHIHQNYADLVLSTETILKLYGILMSYTDVDPVFKTRDNVIIDRSPQGEILKVHRIVPYQHVEKAMDDMIASYWEARNDIDINNLLLIPCFIVDFFAFIHSSMGTDVCQGFLRLCFFIRRAMTSADTCHWNPGSGSISRGTMMLWRVPRRVGLTIDHPTSRSSITSWEYFSSPIASMTGDWLMRSRTRANPVP